MDLGGGATIGPRRGPAWCLPTRRSPLDTVGQLITENITRINIKRPLATCRRPLILLGKLVGWCVYSSCGVFSFVLLTIRTVWLSDLTKVSDWAHHWLLWEYVCVRVRTSAGVRVYSCARGRVRACVCACVSFTQWVGRGWFNTKQYYATMDSNCLTQSMDNKPTAKTNETYGSNQTNKHDQLTHARSIRGGI